MQELEPPRERSASRLSCSASMGSPYGYGGVRTYYERLPQHPDGWTDDELRAMVRRIGDCGFEAWILLRSASRARTTSSQCRSAS